MRVAPGALALFPSSFQGCTIMICQRCKNEASVHLTERKGGKRQELHLCLGCAGRRGWCCRNLLPTSLSTPWSRI